MKPIISKLIAHVVENCSTVDMEERFCSSLDECYSFDSVGGPFQYMQPSRVLRECDPVAFRCGVNDYMDGEDVYEINGDYYDRREVDDCQEEFVDKLDSRETDLSVELEEMVDELEGDHYPEEYKGLRDKVNEARAELEALQADLAEARRYSF